MENAGVALDWKMSCEGRDIHSLIPPRYLAWYRYITNFGTPRITFNGFKVLSDPVFSS